MAYALPRKADHVANQPISGQSAGIRARGGEAHRRLVSLLEEVLDLECQVWKCLAKSCVKFAELSRPNEYPATLNAVRPTVRSQQFVERVGVFSVPDLIEPALHEGPEIFHAVHIGIIQHRYVTS